MRSLSAWRVLLNLYEFAVWIVPAKASAISISGKIVCTRRSNFLFDGHDQATKRRWRVYPSNEDEYIAASGDFRIAAALLE
jgi:hypothetical protein